MRNVAWVAAGTATGQAITLIFTPFIARLYGPHAFGVLGIFQSVAIILLPLAALTYPSAIVLPRSSHNARALVRLSIVVTVGASIVATALFALFGKQLFRAFDIEEMAPYSLWLPVAMLGAGLYQTIQQWMIRCGEFGLIARNAVSRALVVNGGMLLLGLLSPVASMLILVTTFSYILQALMLFVGYWRSGRQTSVAHTCSRRSLRKVARTYADFPLFRVPEQLVNAASQALPVLIITSLFNPQTAGFYGLCRFILQAPVTLVGLSVYNVFYPRFAGAHHNGEDRLKLLAKATAGLAAVGLTAAPILMLWGPPLFDFMFGDEWLVSGQMARWLALWMVVELAGRPALAAAAVLGLQKHLLMYQVVSFPVKALALVLGARLSSDATGAVMLFSIAYAVADAFLISYVFWRTAKANAE